MDKKSFLSKFLSIKTWVTLWSMVIVTFIIFADRSEFQGIAQWLCTVPLAYLGVNVWQKKIISDSETKDAKAEE